MLQIQAERQQADTGQRDQTEHRRDGHGKTGNVQARDRMGFKHFRTRKWRGSWPGGRIVPHLHGLVVTGS